MTSQALEPVPGRSSPVDLEDYASHTYVYGTDVPAALAGLLRLRPGGTVGDFGCGDGTLLMAMRDAGLLTGRDVVGVEGSKTRVDRLRSRWPGLRVVNADVQRVDELADESIDVVVSTQVIEHVPDDRAMSAEMARVLRPGGWLYLTTVYRRWYGWYFHRCNGRWALDPTHLREYERDEELLPALESSGLVVVTETKHAMRFPVVDPILRAVRVFDASKGWLAPLRRARVPIPGYREWEIVAGKPPRTAPVGAT